MTSPMGPARLDRDAARHVVRRTWKLLAPQRLRLFLAALVVVGWTATVVAGPALVRYGIDHGLRPRDAGALDLAVGAYVVVAVLSYLLSRWQILLVAKLGEGFLRDLRVRVFDHLQSLSMAFYDREKAGVIVSRMTSDIDTLAELVQQGLLMFLANGLLLVFTVALLIGLSWQLVIVCLVPVPFVVLASVKFQRDSTEAYLTIRDRIGLVLSSLQEGFAGVRVVQAFAREDVEGDRFTTKNRSLFDAYQRSHKIASWYMPIIEFAGIATTAMVLGIGGWLVHRGDTSVGTVAAFVLLLSNLFEPLQQLSQLYNTVQAAGAGLHKVYDVLDTAVDVPEPDEGVELPDSGRVVLEGVSFAYVRGRDVLRDVDLVVEPGEQLAVVGPTGAGKSTMAKLVARFYDPTEGRVTLGGVDLRHATHASLRERVVVVPQEGFLFNGTILDNVRISRPDATEAEVVDAMAHIGVAGRFEALPDGLRTEVQERGSRFSAGEKQLVSLARAALVDPTVLILDEATSSLDSGTEALVEDALDVLMAGRTSIVIAHRLTTAQRADRVAVVDGGRLLELGTHAELVAAGGAYAALYDSWVGGLAAR
ncbi:MAG: putative transporter permease/ATP-binding protein [Actinomycetia bacterium]|nr:putative transporter permease/ATP-binding protein [Actinomycetes bacterium]